MTDIARSPAAVSPPPATAAVLVIGDEILSGKVEEANVPVLARALRQLGILLARVVVVMDDVETIAREVAQLSREHDWLFTSGGIGPTHDDVTIEAVARAFGVRVVSSPEMEAMLRAHYKDRCTEGQDVYKRQALSPPSPRPPPPSAIGHDPFPPEAGSLGRAAAAARRRSHVWPSCSGVNGFGRYALAPRARPRSTSCSPRRLEMMRRGVVR